MGLRGVAILLLLAVGCGDRPAPPPAPVQAETKEPAPPAKPESVAPVAPEVEPPPAPAPPPVRGEELRKKVAALEKRIAEMERARKEMAARHERERSGLPRVDTKTRRRYLQYIRDAREAEYKRARMEKRFKEIEKISKSAATGKLKELRDQREAIEKRRDEIENAWFRSLDAARLGKIEESPARKDLYLVRAVKRQWFKVSGPARRGRPTASEKRVINKSYRAWLEEVPARRHLVSRVLAQPLGPKRKPDTYDFTDLDFYVLLELLEDTLDRLNVAVENKELKRNRARLVRIQAGLDATEQQIADHIVDSGSELAEYEDLLDRLPAAREKASYLSTCVVEWAGIIADVEKSRARQAREEDEMIVALERARRELEIARVTLLRLG